MNIILKSIKLINFKGIQELEINFDAKETKIYGENGTGKTTIADSIFWLLFGKDSQDRSDFEVQPLDADGKVIHYLDTYVEGTFMADGEQLKLKRLLQEKWTKKKGVADKVFEGTTTSYYVNDLPYKKRDYDTYVYNLIDIEVFKLVTNPTYFSSLNWVKQRKILMEIAGEVSDDEVISSDENLKMLKELLYDSIDNFMKRTKEQIKALKKDRDGIPSRIDELSKQIKADTGASLVALEFRERNVVAGLKGLNERLEAYNGEQSLKNLQKVLENKQKEHQLNMKKAFMEAKKPSEDLYKKIYDAKAKITEKAYEQKANTNSLDKSKQLIARLKAEIKFCDDRRNSLVEKFNFIKDKDINFTSEDSICPGCKRELPLEHIEEIKAEMTKNLLEDKERTFEKIREDGRKNNAIKERFLQEIEDANKNITIYGNKLQEIEQDIECLKATLYDLEQEYEQVNKASAVGELKYDGMDEMLESIKETEWRIKNFNTKVEEEIRLKKADLESSLEAIRVDKSKIEAMEGLRLRIAELKAIEQDLSQSIADLESREFLGQSFIHKKVEMMEEKINKCFKTITFKLFDVQVNGGITECCEALINGVPYRDANLAAKINGGIDIIDTLCHNYRVQAPIIVDNRESVNDLLKINSQIINLIVSNDKNIRVEV